jgi:hypothetical protein
MASVLNGVEPSWLLVWEGGDPHTWGGPQIQWANQRDSEVMLFTLDDDAEVKD